MLHSFLGCFRASQIGCVGCSPSEESVRKFVRNSLSIRPWMASQERPVTRSTLRPTTRVASVSDDSTPHFYLPFTYALPTSASYQCLLPVPPSPCTYALPTCSSVCLPESESEVQVRLKIQELKSSSKIRESLVRCGRVHDC